jgi:DNA-binding HxlR family transcriptional regulator
MKGRDIPYRQGVEYVLGVLRGQWTVAVLAALARGETRRKDILPTINDVDDRAGREAHTVPLTDRVLQDTLRRAEADGLIAKRAEEGPFGATWWRLTPTGRSLLRTLRPLAEWAQATQQAQMTHERDASAP